MSKEAENLVTAMADSGRRREAARALARQYGADDLIVFIADPEIGLPLPAPGFPQTLPAGKNWSSFLSACLRDGSRTDQLPAIDGSGEIAAAAVAAADQTVLALLGGRPRIGDIKNDIGPLLSLLGAVFRAEQRALSAEGKLRAAQTAADQTREMAQKLEATRSQLQQALVTAEAASRLKDDFLATVSHELRTPLNAILGWVTTLQACRVDKPRMEKAIATIERNARSQKKLIDDLLDTSRIISGNVQMEVRTVDLAKIVTAVIDSQRPAAEAKNIRVIATFDAEAGMVRGDPSRLQQIVWNLLSNALKFTPLEGLVEVELKRAGAGVELSVRDTGRGIEQEFLPYVFDRFRQSDSSKSRRYGGLGLGLTIVRQFVELHGGTVRAESPGEGKGATFTVYLPAQRKRSGKAETPPPVAPLNGTKESLHRPPQLAGLRVLFIDAEAQTRELLSAALSSCGARVTETSSVTDALKLLAKEKFDVIVSDTGVPEEDGFSLPEKLRQLSSDKNKKTPVVALTSGADRENCSHAAETGFHTQLAKPVEPARLISTLTGLINPAGIRNGL